MKIFGSKVKTLDEMRADELAAARQNLEHHTEQWEYHTAMIGLYTNRIERLESNNVQAPTRGDVRDHDHDPVANAGIAQIGRNQVPRTKRSGGIPQS